jgi:T4 RnlA family RNA ligase
MNLVQAALQNGETPKSLNEKFGIINRQHPKYPNLHLYKYDQINSPMGEPLVRQCRGLILDANEQWRVISWPFNKFFNYGEGHADTIDWGTTKVQEKLDGSLATLYFYDGHWNMATSGSPDGGGQVNGYDFTFSDLFWKTFNNMGLKVPSFYAVDFSFMFELTTPFNRIVVKHNEPSLHLIGIRNRYDGDEVDVDSAWAKKFGYPTVKSFPLTSFEAITASFEYIDPLNQEGYVVVDGSFNRNKVKSPAYVAIHHMRGNGGPSPKSLLQIVRTNESSELLTHFPEWKPLYDDVKARFDSLLSELEADYTRITAETAGGTQKEFAMRATKTKCSGAMFNVRSGKSKSIKAYLNEMDIKHLLELLKLKDDNGSNENA